MRPALAAAALCAALAAPAHEASRATVEQKEALVRRLLDDSPAVARIEASASVEAKECLRQARESHGKALASLRSADLVAAERELNEAMWFAGKARQLVPDPLMRAIELRTKNRETARAIESLRASYATHLARARGLPRGAAVADARLARIDARLEEASALSASEHLQEAGTILHAAVREMMAALNEVLGTDTLDYAQRFETPAEEYAYELSRLRSFLDLLPLARAELRPGKDASELMERHVASSAALAQRAEHGAARRDYAAAIEAVRQATWYLKGALAAAGLAMPPDAGATPTGERP